MFGTGTKCIQIFGQAHNILEHVEGLFLGLAVMHSMATANLKKSEEFVTNTTAASKYIGIPESAYLN